jgi:response regulator RpfG family c-di-GMP phosphodiesterase
LTSKHQKEDVVAGLDAGANDYVTKPFDRSELQSRLRVAQRMTALQHDLAERIHALEDSLAEVRQLQGLLPICSYCKSIRDDTNYWQKLESYIAKHTNALCSHGICTDCFQKIVKPEMIAAGIDPDELEALTTRLP